MNGVVYFIAGPLGIKIGFTRDLRTRFHTLKLEFGQDIEILGVIEGSMELEAMLHNRFAKHRVYKREWFTKHLEIYSFIQSQASPDYKPYLHKKYAAVNIPFSTYRLLILLSVSQGIPSTTSSPIR
jgi:hypothetical protein